MQTINRQTINRRGFVQTGLALAGAASIPALPSFAEMPEVIIRFW
jgi:hypothetical protein